MQNLIEGYDWIECVARQQDGSGWCEVWCHPVGWSGNDNYHVTIDSFCHRIWLNVSRGQKKSRYGKKWLDMHQVLQRELTPQEIERLVVLRTKFEQCACRFKTDRQDRVAAYLDAMPARAS